LLALDTKLVLVASGLLLVVGTGGFFLLEQGNDQSLADLSLPRALLQSFFYSVASRTSGFAPLNVGDFREETLFFLMGLMFVGGAAGSTAGGIKVNSLAVLAAAIVSASKGRDRIVAFQREIPDAVVMRALTVATLAMVIVVNAALVLTISESVRFLPLAFEATSAFGTVGFSTGITPDLTVAGKLTLVATMFVGRLGPLALAVALVRREQATRVRFPADSVRIG
jgi:trk system potassium uptake protein TrkH